MKPGCADRGFPNAAHADGAVLLLEARGHRCPTPTLRLRRALEGAAAGECVVLLADDPLARIDVPHFVQGAGYTLVDLEEAQGHLRFTVRKA